VCIRCNGMSNSKRNWWFSLAAAVLVVIMGVAAFWPRERGPKYQGKKLSDWIRYDGKPHGSECIVIWQGPAPDGHKFWTYASPRGEDAVRHLGTNAIPSLVKWVAYKKAGWKTKAAAAYTKRPSRLVPNSMQSWLEYSGRERLADGAAAAFMVLGKDAASAAPELASVLSRTSNYETAERLILCLACIGPGARQGLPTLKALAADREGDHRLTAAAAIECIEDSKNRIMSF